MATKAPTVFGLRRRANAPMIRQLERRGSARQRGYDTTWERFAKMWLSERPLCAECARHGRDTLAELVDHIVKLTAAPERRLDPTNLQSLCRRCHAIKTSRGE